MEHYGFEGRFLSLPGERFGLLEGVPGPGEGGVPTKDLYEQGMKKIEEEAKKAEQEATLAKLREARRLIPGTVDDLKGLASKFVKDFPGLKHFLTDRTFVVPGVARDIPQGLRGKPMTKDEQELSGFVQKVLFGMPDPQGNYEPGFRGSMSEKAQLQLMEAMRIADRVDESNNGTIDEAPESGNFGETKLNYGGGRSETLKEEDLVRGAVILSRGLEPKMKQLRADLRKVEEAIRKEIEKLQDQIIKDRGEDLTAEERKLPKEKQIEAIVYKETHPSALNQILKSQGGKWGLIIMGLFMAFQFGLGRGIRNIGRRLRGRPPIPSEKQMRVKIEQQGRDLAELREALAREMEAFRAEVTAAVKAAATTTPAPAAPPAAEVAVAPTAEVAVTAAPAPAAAAEPAPAVPASPSPALPPPAEATPPPPPPAAMRTAAAPDWNAVDPTQTSLDEASLLDEAPIRPGRLAVARRQFMEGAREGWSEPSVGIRGAAGEIKGGVLSGAGALFTLGFAGLIGAGYAVEKNRGLSRAEKDDYQEIIGWVGMGMGVGMVALLGFRHWAGASLSGFGLTGAAIARVIGPALVATYGLNDAFQHWLDEYGGKSEDLEWRYGATAVAFVGGALLAVASAPVAVGLGAGLTVGTKLDQKFHIGEETERRFVEAYGTPSALYKDGKLVRDKDGDIIFRDKVEKRDAQGRVMRDKEGNTIYEYENDGSFLSWIASKPDFGKYNNTQEQDRYVAAYEEILDKQLPKIKEQGQVSIEQYWDGTRTYDNGESKVKLRREATGDKMVPYKYFVEVDKKEYQIPVETSASVRSWLKDKFQALKKDLRPTDKLTFVLDELVAGVDKQANVELRRKVVRYENDKPVFSYFLSHDGRTQQITAKTPAELRNKVESFLKDDLKLTDKDKRTAVADQLLGGIKGGTESVVGSPEVINCWLNNRLEAFKKVGAQPEIAKLEAVAKDLTKRVANSNKVSGETAHALRSVAIRSWLETLHGRLKKEEKQEGEKTGELAKVIQKVEKIIVDEGVVSTLVTFVTKDQSAGPKPADKKAAGTTTTSSTTSTTSSPTPRVHKTSAKPGAPVVEDVK
ncbi:MAG: hypothetical protein HYT76_06000 [Deltaproteobacteria bacterium]|nr:hypothetical protein [Deltaproteobacteria bacterium]